ncbi:zinc transport system substrate-binding protein [Trueperella bonasi]|uniref:Zinc transport system substrate-binding protein n=1 Tax=Trueperella bonasi TaxID=312286 RepID=A0ABT9NE94_9ACTO|nr:ZinT/AdcA family metal-binding protein [Trueperella bonasi]MDP9805706.1 zinc transport system substrate-binding protein [Trueperella bonasi]
MISKNFRRIAIAASAALALTLTACSDSEGKQAPEETTAAAAEETSAEAKEEETKSSEPAESERSASLADWEGEWVSLGAVAHTDAMKPHAEEAAKEHGETLEEVLAEVDEARKTDFAGMVISDDKINFVADLDAVEGAKANEGFEYTFKETVTGEHDGHNFEWFVFEGEDGAPHKYVLLMELHGEETLAHFHMRYGDTIEAASTGADDHWYPTFVQAGEGTDEQIAETLFHHHH